MVAGQFGITVAEDFIDRAGHLAAFNVGAADIVRGRD